MIIFYNVRTDGSDKELLPAGVIPSCESLHAEYSSTQPFDCDHDVTHDWIADSSHHTYQIYYNGSKECVETTAATSGGDNAINENIYLFNNCIADDRAGLSSAGAQHDGCCWDMNYAAGVVDSITEQHSVPRQQHQYEDAFSIPSSYPLDVSTGQLSDYTTYSSHYPVCQTTHQIADDQVRDSMSTDIPPPLEITSTLSDGTAEQIIYGVPEQFTSPIVQSDFAPLPSSNESHDDGKYTFVFPVVEQNQNHRMPNDFRYSVDRSRLASDSESELNRTPKSIPTCSTFQTRGFVKNCAAVLPTTRQLNIHGDVTQSRSEPPTPESSRRRPMNPPPPPPSRSIFESNIYQSPHSKTMTLPRNHKNTQRQTSSPSSMAVDTSKQRAQCRVNGISSTNDADVQSTASPHVKDIRAALLDKISLCQPPRSTVSIATGRSARVSKESFAGVKRSCLSSLSVSSLPAAVMCADVEPRRSFNNAPEPPPRRGSSSVSPSVEPKFHHHYDRLFQTNPDNVRSNLTTFSSFLGSALSTTDLSDITNRENRGITNEHDSKMAASPAAIDSNGDDIYTGNLMKSSHCSSFVDLSGNYDDELSSWIRKQSRNSRRDDTTSPGVGTRNVKPIAQIRPNAIRAPTAASTYIGTKYCRQKQPSYDHTQYVNNENGADIMTGLARSKQLQGLPSDSSADSTIQNTVQTDDIESPPSADSSVNLIASSRRNSTSSTTSASGSTHGGTLSRFGSIKSRIKDYLSAAATGVAPNRKQGLPTTASSMSIGTRQRRADRKHSTEFGDGRHREGSPATRWRPDTEDYAPTCIRAEPEPTVSDHVTSVASEQCSEVSVSCMDRWTTFVGPRPYTTPRRVASHVSVPSGLSDQAPADPVNMVNSTQLPASSFGDVTTSITSRLSTFLTFLGRNQPVTSVSPSSSSVAFDRMLDAGIDKSACGNHSYVNKRATNEPYMRIDKSNKSETGQFTIYRSPSFNKAEVVSSDHCNGLYTATLGRSRSISGTANKRQPIRFVRESHQQLSTFSSPVSGGGGGSDDDDSARTRNKSLSPVETSADIKYRLVHDGEQLPIGAKTALNDRDISKYSTVGNTSFSVSKYIQQRSAPSTPHQVNDVIISNSKNQHSVVGSSDTTSTTPRKPEVKEEFTNDCILDSSVRTTNQRVFVGHVTFGKFDSDIDRLVRALNDATSKGGYQPTSVTQNCAPSVSRRDQLLVLTRRFVADSQRMVSSAVGPSAEDVLANSVQDSLTTLTDIVNAAIGAAGDIRQGGHHQGQQLPSPKAIILLGRVRDLVETYRSTVWIARTAAGLSFDSAEMKTLVTQATSLAAMLGSLIRMLSRVD